MIENAADAGFVEPGGRTAAAEEAEAGTGVEEVAAAAEEDIVAVDFFGIGEVRMREVTAAAAEGGAEIWLFQMR